jgi:N-acetylmuramoyl-L-alanine amidase
MLHLPRTKHGAFRVRPNASRAGWLRAGALLLLAVSLSLAADPDVHHVTAVRFWSLGAVTRIAIQTDGDFQVKSDRLDNPDRLFFDLSGTRPMLGRKGMTVIPVSDHFVKQIRVAEPQSSVTRVVLDLETSVEPTISRLDNPSRLIIELRLPGSPPSSTEPPVRITTSAPPASPAPAPAKSQETPPVAPKPVEHRMFTPPPPRQPPSVPAARPEEASIELPPELHVRSSLPPIPAILAVNYKAGPAPARVTPTSMLAKVTTTSPIIISSPPVQPPSLPPAIENALPARNNISGDRSMIRVLGLKVGRIVLDPGHGGHDTGTVGPEGLREKDLVLDVAQRLGRLIEERMGSEVIFTRSDDTFIPLERRTEIANEAKADLFLSIHANSSPLRSAAGVETYYLNFTTSKSASDLAARENAGSKMTVYELQELLQKIALKDKVEESREFAGRVQTALFTLSAKNTDARSKDRGVKKAPFVVLIGASMPSVLAEIGFVSNAHDEKVMRREEYRERTAEALYKGISSYANSLSHFQVAQRH